MIIMVYVFHDISKSKNPIQNMINFLKDVDVMIFVNEVVKGIVSRNQLFFDF
jgi:hypothetical protein